MNTDIITKRSTIELKAGLYPLSTLIITNSNTETLHLELDYKTKSAPAMFINAPMLIDLTNVNALNTKTFTDIIKIIKNFKIIPVGVITNNKKLADFATRKNIGVFAKNTKQYTPTNNVHKNVLHDSAIRSGQQVAAQYGDLIITEQVSAGAEVLAADNIHIYAPLRGRALAGTSDNINAKIFCDSLEAELVAIAGHYLTADQISEEFWQKRVCIFLHQDELTFKILG